MSPARQNGTVSPVGALHYFQHLASGGMPNPPAIAMERIAFAKHGRYQVDSLPDLSLPQSVRAAAVSWPPPTLSYFQGAVWIEGVVQRTGYDVPFRCPVLFRPVAVQLLENSGVINSHNLRLRESANKKRKWSVTPGLFTEATASQLLAQLPSAVGPLSIDAISILEAAARETIDQAFAAGEQPTLLARGRQGLWDGTGLNTAALQGWTSKDAEAAALAHLYEHAPVALSIETASAQPLQCPLPLNTQQEQIVRRSTTEPLVVVSGPPGTGKTHLVVAAALQQFGEGRSTLIATASEAASDSIAEMLARFPMVTAIRFGSSVQPQILGNQLAEGVPAGESQFHTGWTSTQLDRLDAEIASVTGQLRQRLRATEVHEGVMALRRTLPEWAAVPTETNLANWRDLVRAARPSGNTNRSRRSWALTKLRRSMNAPRSASFNDLEQVLDVVSRIAAAESPRGDVPSARLWEQLESLTDQRSVAAANHLEARRRTDTSPAARRTLGQLATALRHPHPVDRQFALSVQSDEFTETVPLWFGTLQDLENALPARPAMFDLVIFDEASQASQIHGVSALMRAKRALVIGDPRQMRHTPVSSVAERQAAASASKLSEEAATQLDESAVSLFDAAAHQAPVTRLAEHFRCSPHIIGFCNERFYNDRLRLMTQHPGRESRDAIHIVRPAGDTAGDEVRAVVSEISKLAGFGACSIGVVAGHVEHAEALRAALRENISTRDQKRLALRIGTPREFQGIERDSIIISPGLGPENLELLDELQDPNTFNVVASRAKNDVYVVTALTPTDLPDGLLRDYLAWSHLPPEALASQTVGTGWKGELARDLAALNDMRVIVDYPVGGHEVDLAIGVGRLAFGVETSVHPGGVDAHIERHLALRRAGWHILEAFETEWTGRQSESVVWLATQWAQRSATSDQ